MNPTPKVRARWRSILRSCRAEEGRASSRFTFASALYWYCADHHEGQWSRAYSVLCRIRYRPGRSESGPDEGYASELYSALAEAEALS
jgi:hypothetical protein